MSTRNKVFIGIGIMLFVGILLFIIKIQYDAINKLKTIETSVVEQKKIAEGLDRAQALYAKEKDIKQLLYQREVELKKIEEDLEKLRAEITGTITITSLSSGSDRKDLASSYTVPRIGWNVSDSWDGDKYGYLKSKQVLKLSEDFAGKKVPIGEVGFSAWKDKPWDEKIYPRSYESTIVLSEDEDGRNFAYTQFAIVSENKRYKIDNVNSKIIQKYPDPKFMFSPRLYLGVDAAYNLNENFVDVSPNAYVSFISYGKTKLAPTFTFLGIGGGYYINEGRPNFMLKAFTYNLGEVLPLVDNLHIGPSIMWGGAWSFGLGLSGGL